MAQNTGHEPLSHSRIVEATFRAWGRTMFSATSLSQVAQELQITKPALYRYFRNKESLIAALDADYTQRIVAEVFDPLLTSEPYGFPELLPRYVQAMFAFFDRNPYHLAFLVGSMLARAIELIPAFQPMLHKQTRVFTLAAGAHLHLSSAELQLIRRFVRAVVVHHALQYYQVGLPMVDCRRFEPENRPSSPAERDATAATVAQAILNGFVPGVLNRIDAQLIERISWVHPEEVPEPDRMLSAISTVVARDGYTHATVEHIAAEVGITKSSLYFYFKNKDDMLRQYLVREQQRFAASAHIRMNQLNTPEEKLYAIFVLLGSFVANSRVQTTVRNWMRYNNIEVSIEPTQMEEMMRPVQFLSEIVFSGLRSNNPQEAFAMLLLINFLVLQELMSDDQQRSIEEQRATIRRLFSCFTSGVQSMLVPTKESVE